MAFMINIAAEILAVAADIRMNFYNKPNFDEGEFFDFEQIWDDDETESESSEDCFILHPPRISTITIVRTYVFIPRGMDEAYVYFGKQFAYRAQINDAFRKDLRARKMAPVSQSERYCK